MNAAAIKYLALNLGSCHGFGAHRFNGELATLFFAQMREGSDEYSATD
ncbi:MAG TPA: hypothetical protein VHE55_06045 [Fimbriimonadaceae bacterium]|nr:hypothetical protein [Fimbriimonadaceae bacterium]